MKKIIIILFVLPLLGCSLRNMKAELLARSCVKSILYYPESYKAIATQIDSAYTSIYTDDTILKAAKMLVELDKDNSREKLQREYNNAKSSAALWSSSCSYSAYARENYNQEKEKMAEISRKIEELDNKCDIQKNIIRRRAKEVESGEFCGWAILHRYRAKNGYDRFLMSEIIIFTDKNMGNILNVFDLDEDEETGFPNLRKIIDDALLSE